MSEDTEPINADNQGIMDDTPDEIKDFVIRNNVAQKFTVMLKQEMPGGGAPVVLRSYTNSYPDVNVLGSEWGPGNYILVFSWRGEGKNGKKEQLTQEYKIAMSERAWKWPHHDWIKARDKERQEEQEKEWKDEAAKQRVQGGGVAPVSDLDNMKKFLGLAKDLGVPIGGNARPSAPEAPKKSFGEKLLDMAPAITAIGAIVSPIAIAIIQRPREKKDETMMTMLLQHALNKPPEPNPMKDMVPFLMGTVKQIFDLKESMEPPEKETLVEKILGKLAPMVPAVLALATQPREAIEGSLAVKMARADKDIKAVKGDPETLEMMVQRLDETYGFQQTEQILSVAGIARPAELAGNYVQWPSKGFKPDGTVDDGRDVVATPEASEGDSEIP